MAEDRLRIDKWLWFARLAKTRTLAQKLAVSGRIRINQQKIENAARQVKIGDVLTIASDAGVRILRISAIGSRRGPSAEAVLLYEDLTPPVLVATIAERPPGTGRPTKRQRRDIVNFHRDLARPREDFPSDSD